MINSRFPKLYLLICLFVFACKPSKNINQELSSEVSNTSNYKAQMEGDYAGIAPCADCDGIQQIISITAKGKYEWKQIFLNNKHSIYSSKGQLVWDSTETIFELKHPQHETRAFFKVADRMIFQVDKSGQSISGNPTQTYALDKSELGMLNESWLVPLVTDDTLRYKPSVLNFSLDEMAITGSTGCNNFNGSFRLRGDNKISFQKINTTFMACFDAKRESDFLLGLYKAVSYKHDKKKFILYDAKGNTTLSFEVNRAE